MSTSDHESSTVLSQIEHQNKIKHKYNIDFIMSKFSKQNLTFLQKQFRLHCKRTGADGYNLVEFVQIILKIIEHRPDEVYDVIHGSCSLFKEIDINGDGNMEWNEFVSYIVEVAEAQRNNSVTIFSENTRTSKVKEIMKQEEQLPKYLHVSNVLQKALAQKALVFGESKLFIDTLSRNTAVHQALIYKKIDALITLESNTRMIKLLHAQSNKAIPGIQNDGQAGTKILQTIELHLPNEAYILSAAMNEEHGILALTSTEGLIYFYKFSTNIQKFRVFKIICCCGLEGSQHKIWYLPKHKIYFTTGSKHIVREWKIDDAKRPFDPNAICMKCTSLYFPRKDSKTMQHIYENSSNYVERPFNADNQQDATFSYLQPHQDYYVFQDMILDCIEINYPYMSIFTACHDGKIRIIVQSLKRIVGSLETGHCTGIRQLDYTQFHGGALISVGYESFFNCWEMEGSTSFGKKQKEMPKKMHMVSHPVVGARFLGNSYFIVSVDQVNTVKIYNYKTSEVLQTLTQTFIQQQNVTNLLVFSEGKFVVLGKKLVYYDTLNTKGSESIVPSHIFTKKQVEIRKMILNERGMSEMQQAAIFQQESQIQLPIDAIFIESYQTIVVLSKSNIRMYSSRNGRLIKQLDAELGIEASGFGDLTCMCIDEKHRKLYIGDTRGLVRIINVNNGVMLGELEWSEDVVEKLNEGSRANNELCAIKFFSQPHANGDQNFMLISGQVNNRIAAWDVNESEETDMIRTVWGGSVLKEDVITIASSEHHGIIATGGVQGMICLWDFELFRLVGVLLGSRGGVSCLEFAGRYPLLISCSQFGVVSVFTIRGSPHELKNTCIGRFINLNSDYDGFYKNTCITSCFVRIRENPNYIYRQKKKKKKIGFNSSGDSVTSESEYTQSRVKFFQTEVEIENNKSNGSKPEFKTKYSNLIDNYSLGFQSDMEKAKQLTKVMVEGVSKLNIALEFITKIEAEAPKVKNLEHESIFPKYYPPTGNDENPFFLHFVFGDEEGNIKWLDLTAFIREPTQQTIDSNLKQGLTLQAMAATNSTRVPYFSATRPYSDTKIGFMASRRMMNEAGSIGESLLEQANRQKQPEIVDISKCVLTRVVNKAHKQRINSIKPINISPFGFISTGNDKFVKVWSELGECTGTINLVKEITQLDKWKFQFNWDKHSQNQLEQVEEVYEKIRELNQKKELEVDQSEISPKGISPQGVKKFQTFESSFTIEIPAFQQEFDNHPSLRNLLNDQNLSQQQKTKKVNKLFHVKQKFGDIGYYPDSFNHSHKFNQQNIQTKDSHQKQSASSNQFDVNTLFPQKVWQDMIDVEQEKKLIKNLTADYEKFIKVGSIDEIKRQYTLQQSDQPKDIKLVQIIQQRLLNEQKKQTMEKFGHRLSLRMGINLQKAGKSALLSANVSSNATRNNFTRQIKQAIQISKDQPTEVSTSSSGSRQRTPGSRQRNPGSRQRASGGGQHGTRQATQNTVIDPISIVNQQQVPAAQFPQFTMHQYATDATIKIAGTKGLINKLKLNSIKTQENIDLARQQSERNISALRKSLQHKSFEILAPTLKQRSLSTKLLPVPKTPKTKEDKVNFSFKNLASLANKRTQLTQDTEFDQLIKECTKKEKSIQMILDTKFEMQKVQDELSQFDPNFYNQLTERLNFKRKESNTLFTSMSQSFIPKMTTMITEPDLKAEKQSKFKRKDVVGLSNSRNTSGKFLSRIDRFVNVSDRKFKMKKAIKSTVDIESSATQLKVSQSQQQIVTYEGDMMLRPGEQTHRLSQAMRRQNQMNYAIYKPNTDSSIFQDVGRSFVRNAAEWKTIEKNQKINGQGEFLNPHVPRIGAREDGKQDQQQDLKQLYDELQIRRKAVGADFSTAQGVNGFVQKLAQQKQVAEERPHSSELIFKVTPSKQELKKVNLDSAMAIKPKTGGLKDLVGNMADIRNRLQQVKNQ